MAFLSSHSNKIKDKNGAKASFFKLTELLYWKNTEYIF